MLNFLNQHLPGVRDNKENISKEIETILDLINAYDQHNFSSLQYVNENSPLNFMLQNKAPEVQVAPILQTSHHQNHTERLHSLSTSSNNTEDIEETNYNTPEENPFTETPVVGNFIKAHMSGAIYLQPSPTEDNFVRVGEKISTGQVVCLLEAMKLFSELKSPYDGTVKKVFFNHGDIVKEGDIIFEVEA